MVFNSVTTISLHKTRMFPLHVSKCLAFKKSVYCVLFSSEGEDWLKMRSVLRQLIMRPRDVAVFSDDVNRVVDDLIKRVSILSAQGPDGATVFNVNDLFFKYAMEGW